jgi:glutamine amidotransferase
MCRVLAYVGEPVDLEDLLYRTDCSLLHQVYDPQLMSFLNLAGFGMMAWDERSHQPRVPFVYKTAEIPTYDRNLRSLSGKLRPTSLVAHIRGVTHSEREVVGQYNLHPFRWGDRPVALAQNGTLSAFATMRYDLLPYIRPELASQIEGTTDTEWLYALVLSQLPASAADLTAEDYERALVAALELIREVRVRRKIADSSALNLVVCDGRCLVATRFTYDYGWYEEDLPSPAQRFKFVSLWFTSGSGYRRVGDEWVMGGGEHDRSLLLSSEPLTSDASTWVEVPEYSMLTAWTEDRVLRLRTQDLDL